MIPILDSSWLLFSVHCVQCYILVQDLQTHFKSYSTRLYIYWELKASNQSETETGNRRNERIENGKREEQKKYKKFVSVQQWTENIQWNMLLNVFHNSPHWWGERKWNFRINPFVSFFFSLCPCLFCALLLNNKLFFFVFFCFPRCSLLSYLAPGSLLYVVLKWIHHFFCTTLAISTVLDVMVDSKVVHHIRTYVYWSKNTYKHKNHYKRDQSMVTYITYRYCTLYGNKWVW